MRSSIFTTTLSVGILSVTSVWAATPPDSEAAAPAPEEAAAPKEAPATAPAAADKGDTGGTAAVGGQEEERSALNAVYLEGLGSGLLYSVNYDRRFEDFSARVGFSYMSVSVGATDASGTTGSKASASILTVPITVSYLGIGGRNSSLELGIGATIIHAGAGASTFNVDAKDSASSSATVVLATGLVGYRYQPADGGFFFRTGIAPIAGGDAFPVIPWPYLALGGTF